MLVDGAAQQLGRHSVARVREGRIALKSDHAIDVEGGRGDGFPGTAPDVAAKSLRVWSAPYDAALDFGAAIDAGKQLGKAADLQPHRDLIGVGAFSQGFAHR